MKPTLFKVAAAALLLAFLVMLGACDSGGVDPALPDIPVPVDKKELNAECNPGAPSLDALSPAGHEADASRAVLPNGQAITPAGKWLLTRKFPWGLALSSDGTRAYVSNGDGMALQVIDLTGDDPVQKQLLSINAAHGLALTADDATLYVSGGPDADVKVLDVSGETATVVKTIALEGYISGLVLSADESTLYGLTPTQSRLFKVNLSDDSYTAATVGHYPYDVVLTADGATAFVSNWGRSSVSVVDTATMQATDTIEVEKNPEGMALVEDGAYLMVTNSDSDSISIIDVAALTVVETLDLDPDLPELKAWSPNAVVVHPAADAHRAYVASADHNAIEVIDTATWDILGSIPTAWYPVRLAMTADGSQLALVNAKGWGSRTDQATSHGIYGLFQILDTPANQTELEGHTRRVNDNNDIVLGFYPDNDCDNRVPVPLNEDERSVIEHIVLIVKENKTYDQILGDLVGDEGDDWHDPELTMFGETVTPNGHAIARRWVDMVNFYCDSEVSLQGHMWTTQADCNDYTEKLRYDRYPITGVDPATITENGSIFTHLDDNGINFRVYGEVVNFAFDELEKWRDKIDLKYPFWSQGVTDVAKATEVIREWDLAVETGDERLFPPFIYIVLPNDHNFGNKPGKPTPSTMVADNDHGMGMLLDWLSHSPFWEKTLFIAIEDDAQSGFDHLDPHRSVFFVASPWVKRGLLSEVHYSIPSIYRTMDLIFGIPTLNKNTYMAPPILDIFTDEPDYTPYEAIVPDVPYEIVPEDSRIAPELEEHDWSFFDGKKGLEHVLWRMTKGDKPIPSYAKWLDE